LQLGGAHRLNPLNDHQSPCVAVLCGVHQAGLQAASAARQLASHGVRTIMFVDDSSALPGHNAQLMLDQLSLLRFCTVKITKNVQGE